MNSKFLVGGLIGFVLFFLLGWLVYGMLLADMMAGYMNTECTRPMEEMNMSLMILGNVGFGLMFSYILSNGGAKFASFSGGAIGGAIVGLLVSLSYDSMIYAQSTMMNSFNGIIMDVVAFTIISAVAGGGIGWWLGRK